MDFKFGPFAQYLLYVIYYWYFTLPVGVWLLLLCFRRKNSRPLRWMSGIGAVPLLFPFVVLLWELTRIKISERRESQEYRQMKMQHTFILKQPETVAGIDLLAGDTVYYGLQFDMNNRPQAQLMNIDSVHLLKPALFFNIEAKRISRNQNNEWDILLARDQLVAGWPCTGNVVIDADSTFISATLSREYTVWGYRAQKNSKLIYQREDKRLRIILPDSKRITIDEQTKEVLFESD